MILHIWICFLKVFYGMQTPYLKVQLVSISFRAFFYDEITDENEVPFKEALELSILRQKILFCKLKI